MANSVSDLKPAFWANEAERSLFVENKALAIANTTLRNILAGEGNVVYRTIVSYPASQTYTPGSDVTGTAVTGSKEALTVSTYKTALVTIDDTEKVQSIIDLGRNISQKMMMMHNNSIEQAVVAEVTNALWSLDDGNVGGSAGSNASLNTSNVYQLFTAADTKLDATDAPKAGRTALVGTHTLNMIKLAVQSKNTVFGDGVLTRGVVASIMGWDILYTNNLPYYAVLTLATNPTTLDTITIAGVTFTFRDSLLGTEGEFNIADTPTNNIINLAAALNTPQTAIAETSAGGYTAISSENIFVLRDKRRLSATIVTAATTLSIAGYGDIVVSETLTAPADVWSSQRQDSLFCVKGAIDLIVQIPPKIEVVRDQDQFADIVKSLIGYGKKTYADGARELVRVKINAGTSDWA